jgi:hypothetical protein
MDPVITIILIVFAVVVVYLGLRYRTQILDEVEDIFDGDDDENTREHSPQPSEPKPMPASPPKMAEAGDVPPPQPIPAPPLSGAEEPQAPWDSETETGSVPDRGPTRSRGTPPTSEAQPPSDTGGSSDDSVKFSAYYPRETAPQTWQPLAAYVFRQSASGDVIKDVRDVLGTRLTEFRRTEEDARSSVVEGAQITATPTLPGFQINPPTQTIGFFEPFHRFDFKLRATSAPLDQAANGLITFSIEGVIVADLPLSIFVGQSIGEAITGAITKPVYQAIFCSYSHDDTHIIERVEKAYKALGLTFLRDVETLKSGQAWNEELLRMIEQADIFQLFWSETAAGSKYVRQEWEHALKHQRQIRPVYWNKPIPKVPDELRSLHFAYMPDLAK